MTHDRFRRSIAAAAVAAACALLARPALAGPPNADKKPAPGAVQLAPDYRLGPGDKLRIEVYKDPQVSQSLQVRPDGKITLPLVGDIDAAGRTPEELRDTIANQLKEYITNPVVTVIVVEALASNVYVMGEVATPGPVLLHGPTTVLQALAMAGGFKEFANTKDVRVLRPQADGTMQTIKFNYNDAIKGEKRPMFLRAGDTVVVP
jgi:polysaccharide export outer membrane protein